VHPLLETHVLGEEDAFEARVQGTLRRKRACGQYEAGDRLRHGDVGAERLPEHLAERRCAHQKAGDQQRANRAGRDRRADHPVDVEGVVAGNGDVDADRRQDKTDPPSGLRVMEKGTRIEEPNQRDENVQKGCNRAPVEDPFELPAPHRAGTPVVMDQDREG